MTPTYQFSPEAEDMHALASERAAERDSNLGADRPDPSNDWDDQDIDDPAGGYEPCEDSHIDQMYEDAHSDFNDGEFW